MLVFPRTVCVCVQLVKKKSQVTLNIYEAEREGLNHSECLIWVFERGREWEREREREEEEERVRVSNIVTGIIVSLDKKKKEEAV